MKENITTTKIGDELNKKEESMRSNSINIRS